MTAITALTVSRRNFATTIDGRNLGYVGEAILTELLLPITTELGDNLTTEGGVSLEGLHVSRRTFYLTEDARN